MLFRAVRATTIALALGLLPGLARAQSVRGTIVGPATVALSGVVVVLLDSTSSPAVHALSDQRGAFRLTAPGPGMYRLRTLRIGFQTTTSESFRLAAGQDAERTVRLSAIRFQLDTVRVVGRNQCRLADDSAYATYAIWEQVRTALTAVRLTAHEANINSLVVAYERTLDRTERLVRTQTHTFHSAMVTELWNSAAPERLRRDGFVANDGADGAIYFAPGIDALLSREFVEDHCFRLSTSVDPSLLGISFEPTPDRKRIPEVRGTLWLVRATSELRRMDFGYVNVQRKHLDEASGTMDFVQMKDGRWAVARWNIKMPVLIVGMSSGNEAKVAEIKVAGGELTLAVRGTDTLFRRPPLLLGGNVVDSVSGAAVGGARVALAGTDVAAVADAAGRFMLRDVLPGMYTLTVRTPSLDSVTAVSQSTLSVTDARLDLSVRVPTGQQIAASLCGSSRVEAPGIVIGTVELRGDSITREGLRVAAEWPQPYMKISGAVVERGTRPRWIETSTDARGRFRLCGVPVNVAVTLRAESDSAGVTDTLTIPPGGRLARTSLVLDWEAPRGGVFAGFVVTDSNMLPIMGAEIAMPELDRRVQSNERGAFRLTDVPAGTHRVLVRRPGYGPMETQIAFASGETQQRRVVLSPGASGDEGVAERLLIPSFEENRAGGVGFFMTRTELDRQRERRLSDVLSRVPGVSISRGRANAGWIVKRQPPPAPRRAADCPPDERCEPPRNEAGSGVYCPDDTESRQGVECGCYAQVYMNNSLLSRGNPTPPFDINAIASEQVEALEYYRSAAETPLKYRTLDTACGVLIVWTRRS
jgi:hypothetical protein